MSKIDIRLARVSDITNLVSIEVLCFETDLLSMRSFRNFIKPGPHQIIVLEVDDKVIGYALVLYRKGTNLARLYSIAILPPFRGQGFARQLLAAAESYATSNYCVYMRLEVEVENHGAYRLYEKQGYRVFERVKEYYEDGADAFRMEKRIHSFNAEIGGPAPYYQQTMDFTCGPASLMMAIKMLKHDYEMTRHEELQIWREATTIFMTAGHGGCSPHGLALSAWHRGFDVSLHMNRSDAPFIDSVRGEEKKAVVELVHQDFLDQIAETDIEIHTHELTVDEMDVILHSGKPVLALISTWRLNRNKAPHWVLVTSSDERFVYINDPDIDDDEPHYSEVDYIQIPIEKKMFREMARFGQKRLRALLVISVK